MKRKIGDQEPVIDPRFEKNETSGPQFTIETVDNELTVVVTRSDSEY